MSTLDKNDSKNNKRGNFTATFDRYETDKLYEVKLHFTNIKNEVGVIVKSRYWLKARDTKDILDKLMPGEEIAFSAVLEVVSEYGEGFKLLDPVVTIKK